MGVVLPGAKTLTVVRLPTKTSPSESTASDCGKWRPVRVDFGVVPPGAKTLTVFDVAVGHVQVAARVERQRVGIVHVSERPHGRSLTGAKTLTVLASESAT